MYMSPEEISLWILDMKQRRKIKTDGDAAKLLGVTRQSLHRMKKRGSTRRVSLACAALIAGLGPYRASLDHTAVVDDDGDDDAIEETEEPGEPVEPEDRE